MVERTRAWQGSRCTIKKKLHLPYPKITFKHSKLQEMLNFAIISINIHEFALTSRLSYLGPQLTVSGAEGEHRTGFWKWRKRKEVKCKGRAGRTRKDERRGRLSRADGFSAFARGAPYSLKTLKVRRGRWREMMSCNANYTSALPLRRCFRTAGRENRRSSDRHHQHCAMFNSLSVRSNRSWHMASVTPWNVLPMCFLLHFCLTHWILLFLSSGFTAQM